jgi:hypothetical protein
MDGKVVRCFKEEKWVSCQMPCKFFSRDVKVKVQTTMMI